MVMRKITKSKRAGDILMLQEDAVTVSGSLTEEDRRWLTALWSAQWGGDVMVSRGKTYRLRDQAVLIARRNGARTGAAAYNPETGELLSLNAVPQGSGVGSALLRAFEQIARQAGLRRVWLVTSNDNLDSLRFYQRRGYRIAAVYPNAVDQARRLKPQIPLTGCYGIPVRDEIELEKELP